MTFNSGRLEICTAALNSRYSRSGVEFELGGPGMITSVRAGIRGGGRGPLVVAVVSLNNALASADPRGAPAFFERIGGA